MHRVQDRSRHSQIGRGIDRPFSVDPSTLRRDAAPQMRASTSTSRHNRRPSDAAPLHDDSLSSSSSSSSDNWKTQIHTETRQRFKMMKREAEEGLRSSLENLSSSPSEIDEQQQRKQLIQQHSQAMSELQQAMTEEMVARVHHEGVLRGLVVEEEEGGQRNLSFAVEVVKREQQAIWDNIRKTHNHSRSSSSAGTGAGAGVGGATGPGDSPRIQPIHRFSGISQQRRNSGSMPMPAIPVENDYADRNNKVHWTPSSVPIPRSALKSPSPPTPSLSSSFGSSSNSNSNSSIVFHERWIPSVKNYADDMREQATKEANAARTKMKSRAKHHPHHQDGSDVGAVGTSPPLGSWRDWTKTPAPSIPDAHRRNVPARPPTAPPRNEAFTTRQRAVSEFGVKKAPHGHSHSHSSSSSGGRGQQQSSGMESSSAAGTSPTVSRFRVVDDREASSGHSNLRRTNGSRALGHQQQLSQSPVSSASAAAAAALAERERERNRIIDDREHTRENQRSSHRNSRATPAPASGVYQKQLDDLASRLRRELSITA